MFIKIIYNLENQLPTLNQTKQDVVKNKFI